MQLAIVRVAIFLALVFEAGVYGWQPGIGYVVFWLSGLAATILCNRAFERPALSAPWMFVPSLFFAASVTLHDAAVVKAWSTSLGLIALLWAVAWNLTREREEGALGRLFPEGTMGAGRLLVAGKDSWAQALAATPRGISAPVLRGLLLAVPLLLVFGTLLASADLIFARALSTLGQGLDGVSFAFPLRLALWLVLFAGWLRLWLTAGKATAPRNRCSLGATEVLVAVAALNVLLLVFLAIQARYLFGGTALVEALGLNYAEYARRGFFELSACIALILPLVMTAYQASGSQELALPGGYHNEPWPALRWAGGLLVLQAAGLAVCAFRRMLLYIETFGLSVERFYAAAGILVAMAVLAWAAYACLRPQAVSWILARQTVTVMFLLGALSLINVENAICRYNLGRAGAGRALDVAYFRTLSCDAVPALMTATAGLGPTERDACLAVARELIARAGSASGPSWNHSRVVAKACAP